MLESMRVLREVYPRPRRTMLIGLWSGEEQGLNGSRAFSEDHPEVVRGLQALWNSDNGTGRIANISALGLVDAGGSIARWLSRVPREASQHVSLELPGTPSGGGSDYSSFLCYGAPSFNLGALAEVDWDYGASTWHTNRDTYDKLVFDDLRNNVVLTASLAYLASEDPELTSRTRREVMTTNRGAPRPWPSCGRADRASPRASR
jgi:Zn-dependent M28 family amino/carboxypeptidase